jgi:hypothetical protein
MSAVIYLISPQGLMVIILTVISGATIYFGVMFILKGLSKKELLFLKELILFRK